MNDQRKVIFEDRRKMMAAEVARADHRGDARRRHRRHRRQAHSRTTPTRRPGTSPASSRRSCEKLNLDLPVDAWAKEEGIADEEIAARLHKAAEEAYAERVKRNTPEAMRYVEKQVILQTLDHLWREHLVTLDHLRQVIGWRGMAQRDPLNEYKSEAFELFQQLIEQWHEAVIAQMTRVEVRFQRARAAAAADAVPARRPEHAERTNIRSAADRVARTLQLAPSAGRRRSPSATRSTPRPGAGSAATSSVPAARARSSSTATVRWLERPAQRQRGHEPR